MHGICFTVYWFRAVKVTKSGSVAVSLVHGICFTVYWFRAVKVTKSGSVAKSHLCMVYVSLSTGLGRSK